MEIRECLEVFKNPKKYFAESPEEEFELSRLIAEALDGLITFAEEALKEPKYLFIAELQSRIKELEKPSETGLGSPQQEPLINHDPLTTGGPTA